MKADYEEKTVSRDTIYKGRIVSLYVDEVSLPDGSIGKREIVKHTGAVGIIALQQGKMLMVEQYRKPLERTILEIPAGRIESGEDPRHTAVRELEEETGYRCGKLTELNSFYTSPGFADELIYLFVAEQLTTGRKQLDEDEFLQHREVTLEQARRMMSNGLIKDAKTITAVYAWELYERTGAWK